MEHSYSEVFFILTLFSFMYGLSTVYERYSKPRDWFVILRETIAISLLYGVVGTALIWVCLLLLT